MKWLTWPLFRTPSTLFLPHSVTLPSSRGRSHQPGSSGLSSALAPSHSHAEGTRLKIFLQSRKEKADATSSAIAFLLSEGLRAAPTSELKHLP